MSIRSIGPKLVFESCGADIDEIDYIHIAYSSAEQFAERINGRRRGSSHQDSLTANTAQVQKQYRHCTRVHAQCFKDVEELACSWDGEQMGRRTDWHVHGTADKVAKPAETSRDQHETSTKQRNRQRPAETSRDQRKTSTIQRHQQRPAETSAKPAQSSETGRDQQRPAQNQHKTAKPA